MQARDFQQVDVFTATPYLGNPVAVVLQGDGLDEATMQRFAQWTHLSETTFMLTPTDPLADYRLRIFTPGGELQFAGHPTLGSCHAWLAAGGKPKSGENVVQQCGVGLVSIQRDGDALAFAAPPLQRSAVDAGLIDAVAAALGLAPTQIVAAQMLDNGTRWLGLLLDNTERVAQLRPDFARLKAAGHKLGVAAVRAGPPTPEQDADLLVRGFAPHMGIDEDPVTGSLNAALAQWLIAEGHMPASYVAAQGAALGRKGRVRLHTDTTGRLWVAGQSVTCIEGSVRL